MTEPVAVGVRYIGPLDRKDDTLLRRRGRVWRRGEVLQVPPADAASYLKHPSVWAPGDLPWEEPVATPDSSPAALLALFEKGDAAGLRAVRPDLAALWCSQVQALADASETRNLPRAPLVDEDSGRLLRFVPCLAQAIVQGTSDGVFQKIDMVRDLLAAYPPLMDGCLEAERAGKARKDVLRRLDVLAHELARERDTMIVDALSDTPEAMRSVDDYLSMEPEAA